MESGRAEEGFVAGGSFAEGGEEFFGSGDLFGRDDGEGAFVSFAAGFLPGGEVLLHLLWFSVGFRLRLDDGVKGGRKV